MFARKQVPLVLAFWHRPHTTFNPPRSAPGSDRPKERRSMWQVLRDVLKQPYRVIALILGVLLIAAPTVTIDKSYVWTTHEPTTLWLVMAGVTLLALSAAAYFFELWWEASADAGRGVDLSLVKESKGIFSTEVAGCEIRVVNGRLEEHAKDPNTAVVLPCNEYFDDRCVEDTRSALGAYINEVFQGQVEQFVSLMLKEAQSKFGPGSKQQKTEAEVATSYGVARCLLLTNPLGRRLTIALLSTTTQRAGQGLHSRISYLFDGMRDLVNQLGNARINEVVTPVLGSGHGGVDPPLAFVGLLGAVAEAARYAQGSQRLKRVTVVVFRRDARSKSQVDSIVVKRALGLVSSLR